MRVLLIAPHNPELQGQREEIRDIVNSGLDVEVLGPGNVYITDVIRACRDDYDVLWFTGHGGREGVKLSGDQLLTPGQLTAIANGCNASLVVLNTCSSVSLAQRIASGSHADVIATISDEADATAYTTGALLAEALADTGDAREAFKRVRTGNGNYVFIESNHSMPINAEVAELRKRVEALEKEFFMFTVRTNAAIKALEQGRTREHPSFWITIVVLMLLTIGAFTVTWFLAGGGVAR